MQLIRVHLVLFSLLVISFTSCESTGEPIDPNEMENPIKIDTVDRADIDLNNWKVTLPIGNPIEIEPPEILEYYNIDIAKPYMYDDLEDLSIVFYTEPGSSTANSSYSRTELREQMSPGSNKTNWTFAAGGKMSGSLKVENISTDSNGDLDRIIVMQIHGRLTDEQRELIGEDDNNAPPVVKIYWDEGKIDFRRKILKDTLVNDIDILKKESWKDESYVFDQEVGYDVFSLTIEAADNLLKVSLNGIEEFVFEDIHVEKWGVFENYFKAGNYLQSTDPNSHATVKYYSLEVDH